MLNPSKSASRRTLAAVVCALAATLALTATPALAAVSHVYLPGPSGELTKGLPRPLAMAVDPSKIPGEPSELYAVETHGETGNRLAKFNASSGAFVSQFPEAPGLGYFEGVAVAHATGEVYVAAFEGAGVVGVFNAAGTLQKVWRGTETAGGGFGNFGSGGYESRVAVDNSTNLETTGDVYVVSQGGPVDVFKPGAGGSEETKPVAEITGVSPSEPFHNPTAVAVDEANGDVLVVEGRRNVVDVFKPTVLGEYEFVRQIAGTPTGLFPGEVRGVVAAGGAGNGEIYVTVANLNVPADQFVEQFSAEGVYLGRLEGISPSEPFSGPRSVAVDPSTGDVIVTDTSAVDVFGPDLIIPDVMTEPATEVEPRSAMLNGTVNALEAQAGGPATCEFVWGETRALGRTQKCAQTTIEGSAPVAVSAQLAGLAPDTTYFYLLQASDKNGSNQGEAGQVHQFTTPGASIESESVTGVTNDSVSFQVTIEPNNAPVTYYFQYVEAAGYEASASNPYAAGKTTAVASVAAGKAPVEVAQLVQGLSANTVYHYRVVVVSELSFGAETFDGADATFTTPATGEFVLPDRRQWQMVSPPQKLGVLIEPIAPSGNGSVVQAAADGHAMTYVTDAPTETGPAGYDNFVQVLSTRGLDGWESKDLTVPHTIFTTLSIGEGQEYRLFSQDLSQAAVQPFGAFVPCVNGKGEPQACISPEASEQTPFLEDTTSALFTPLVTGCPASGACRKPVEEHENVPPGTVFGGGEFCRNLLCGPGFGGATPDFSHIILDGSGLTSTPTPEGATYEWIAGAPPAQQLRLVSLLPPNATGEVLPAGQPPTGSRTAISSDGSRVVWEAGGARRSHLYLRENATQPQSNTEGERCTEPAKACTVQLDAGLSGFPAFQTASSDGSRVFFIENVSELYEYEVGHGPAVKIASGLPGGLVIGASEDGAYVYFVSDEVLATGAVSGACRSLGGTLEERDHATCNLYVRHEGVTRLVAVLMGADDPTWGFNGLKQLTARVSPDGRWLAFMSQRSLTGYDNRDAVSGHPDEEVFLYHAPEDFSSGSGSLVCASCNPTGQRPHGVEYGVNGNGAVPAMPLAGGDRTWEGTTWLAANIPGWTPYTLSEAIYQSRYLSNSGRLFFNSSDALVPEDVNGTGDVYEYEPAGVGPTGAACGPGAGDGSEVFMPEREAGPGVVSPAGCVALISSGSSAQESAFLDASENGSDVFFLTSAKLAPEDTDNALDVYDAHECTAESPCPAPVGAPPPCDTEASCKAAPTPQPQIYGPPSTATFSGPGNLAAPPGGRASNPPAKPKPTKCKRGFVKKKVKKKERCVKQKKPKHSKAKKSAHADRRAGR